MKEKNKIISACLIAGGFLLNFIAIVLLLIPFITREQNKTLTTIGLVIYFFVFILIGAGLVLIIKNKKK